MKLNFFILIVCGFFLITSCAKDNYNNSLQNSTFNYQEEVYSFFKKNKNFEQIINSEVGSLEINWNDRLYYNSALQKRMFHLSFLNPIDVKNRYSLSFEVDSTNGIILNGALLKYQPSDIYYSENKGSIIYKNFTGIISSLKNGDNAFTSNDSVASGVLLEKEKKINKKADGWSGAPIDSDWIIGSTNGVFVVICPICNHHHTGLSDLQQLDRGQKCLLCGNCLRDCAGGGMINNGGGGTQPPIDPGYGGNGGGNQTPQEKEKISKKRDCDHIKKMKNDQNLINGLNGLKQHALNNNARTEKGMLYNTSDGLLNGSPSILEGNANDPSIQINFGPTTRINGISHTHYQGLNPIFSASDISAIGILGKGGVIADKGSFSSTLITNEGNVYMLKIHDIDMFNKWAITFSSDPLDVDNLLNIVSLSFPMGPELSQSKNEENLVKMIDALGTGLKLFRGNLDFSDWVGLKKNKENNKIEADPCD